MKTARTKLPLRSGKDSFSASVLLSYRDFIRIHDRQNIDQSRANQELSPVIVHVPGNVRLRIAEPGGQQIEQPPRQIADAPPPANNAAENTPALRLHPPPAH